MGMTFCLVGTGCGKAMFDLLIPLAATVNPAPQFAKVAAFWVGNGAELEAERVCRSRRR